MEIRLSGTVNDSIVDGMGIRYTVFVQGCPHVCEGCHNPQTHDFKGGYIADTEDILKEIFGNPLLDGVTFSGGEPFCQPAPLAHLANRVKESGLNVACYTGFTFEKLLEMSKTDSDVKALLCACDVLIDGPFVLEKRDLLLSFRGSGNQRIIDVQKSLRHGKALDCEEWLN